MDAPELRDGDDARRFLTHGLWLQRVRRPRPGAIRAILDWAVEIAAAGQPLPPTGFLADAGALLTHADRDGAHDLPAVPGFSAGQIRTYEDHVLGKLYADSTFARAGDVVRRLKGRDQIRGVAFVVNQFRDRAGLPGALLGPASVKALADSPAESVLNRAWDELSADGPLPLLPEMTAALIAAVRGTDDVLAAEDVFELEHGTALAELSQRVALRQVLHFADRFSRVLPRLKVRPAAGRREVATRVFDEDVYPVGGFAAIATRGSVESLLHSQLAYMEPAGGERPDLFDIKFLRDELLYYSRDENQFLRRRRTFVIVLWPDLLKARFKDRDLPAQRVILTLAWLAAVVRRLIDWLDADALTIEFLFPNDGQDQPLAAEAALLNTVFRDEIRGRVVAVRRATTAAEVGARVVAAARVSECRALGVSTKMAKFQAKNAVIHSLRVHESRPSLTGPDGPLTAAVTDGDPLDAWVAAAEQLLAEWI